MNDESEKLEVETPDEPATAGASGTPAEGGLGQPASEGTAGEHASSGGVQDAGAHEPMQETSEPSGDEPTSGSQIDESSVPDVLETAASDDTVMDEVTPAGKTDELEDGDEEDNEDEVAVTPAGPIELDVPEEEDIQLNWYILKVQSNRERSIADALRRKIAIEGIDHYFGQVLVPTEKVTEFKGGKKKVVERKLWPGYIAVEMHVNDDTWFAIRETSGIGDFTGSAGKPTPMQPHEIAMILHTEEEEAEEAPKLDIKFTPGDKVKVMEGNFENFEGEVSSIDEAHGRVTVMLSIFGRPTPVELEYWQVEGV